MAKRSNAGRPKELDELIPITSLKGTRRLIVWLDGLKQKAGSRNRVNLVFLALKKYAESVGYDVPMPRR